ncbi:hypothetical protein R3P38DRAFT_2560486, partial [Favolaschia claudopus]
MDHDLQGLDTGSYNFEYQCVDTELHDAVHKNPTFVGARVPFHILVTKLTREEGISVCKLHNLPIPKRRLAGEIRAALEAHDCQIHDNLVSLWRFFPGEVEKAPKVERKSRNEKVPFSDAYRSDQQERKFRDLDTARFKRRLATGRLPNTEFPPNPLEVKDVHRISRGVAAQFDPRKFEEAGCAVCGCLTEKTKLTKLEDFKPSLDLLKVPGVTRQERFSITDDVRELDGPVLASGCEHVCVSCEDALAQNKIPKLALANSCWIGDIPPQLQGLKYAE